MKLNDLPTSQEVLARQLEEDPELRKEWDRTAFARAVALLIVGYRADHGLTQTELAKRLGMKQPAVARLESGDETPTLKTLARVSAVTGLEFHLDIAGGDVAISA